MGILIGIRQLPNSLRMSFILVVGSAHLDLLARAKDRDDVVDREGTLKIGVGGTACNVAVNIANVGTPVRFLTALNDEEISKVIEHYLSKHGVENFIHRDNQLPSSGFSAHIDTSGEITSAISSMAVEDCKFPDSIIESALEGAKAVMVDCNLSVDTIRTLATKAKERNIPIYVSAVSEPKSVRWAGVSDLFRCAFMNKREATFLSNNVFGRRTSAGELSGLLKTPLLITDAENGSTLAMPDGRLESIPAPTFSRETLVNGTRLGMGDAMAAGVMVMHEIHGFNLSDAAAGSLKMVKWIGESLACNRGDPNALETAMSEFKVQASRDAMTGALNRSSIEKVMTRAVNERRGAGISPFSILMVDIDHFKSINDQYGHNVGDEVIQQVAEEIRGALRGEDSFGRWGGEEFVVVLEQTDVRGAILVAQRIRESVMTITSPRQITASLGCAEFERSKYTDVKSLVEAADKALYDAKHAGRNKVRAIPVGNSQ